MDKHNCSRRWKPWSEWSIGAKVLVIVGGSVGLVGLATLFAAVTMWLWNWLMPAIFKLPAIGFWQAAGLILLAQILFKGGNHLGRAGRSHRRGARLRQSMREAEQGDEGSPAQD